MKCMKKYFPILVVEPEGNGFHFVFNMYGKELLLWNNIFEFNIWRNYIFEECSLFDYPGEENIIELLYYYVLLT